ncbi:MAG: glycine cleavage system protein GcvH [Candidatus Coatesbacteria bacterium]|nr:MAG: glycine cleavage system protein GcvH [Candidatus Coatesbacteria bacterium]
MVNIPDNLSYSETHEWLLVEGNVATIGITDHAQNELGDIVYLEVKDPGTDVPTDGEFGIIESVKAASDLYLPVGGKVTEVNEAAVEDPAIINKDPYGDGWLAKVELADPGELEKLMDAAAYGAFIGE